MIHTFTINIHHCLLFITFDPRYDCTNNRPIVIVNLSYSSVHNNSFHVIPDCASAAIDVVFLVDATVKFSSSDWQLMLSFINAIIKQFTVSQSAVRVGLVRYVDTATVDFSLDKYSDTASVQAAVSALSTFSTTLTCSNSQNLSVAFDVARNAVFTRSRPTARKARNNNN